jgi:hypothetical protein
MEKKWTRPDWTNFSNKKLQVKSMLRLHALGLSFSILYQMTFIFLIFCD